MKVVGLSQLKICKEFRLGLGWKIKTMEDYKPKVGDKVVIDGEQYRYVNDEDDMALIRYYAEGMMRKHGLNDYRFIWDKAVRRFGCHNGRNKIISLSFTLAKITPLSQVRDTILHEIGHALDFRIRGFSNHDNHWRRIALSIGSNGRTCSKGINKDDIGFKHLYSCQDCGHQWKYHRRMTNLRNRFHITCRRKGFEGKIVKLGV